METKNKMREMCKKKLRLLSNDYILFSDKKIYDNILHFEKYKNASIIFCYVSMGREVDTRNIIEYSLKVGKRVGVPKCVSRGIMNVYEINSFDDLKEGKFGILEPAENCRSLEKNKIDLAIVPCISCDISGRRLGYGGGYYDRYINEKMETVVLCRKKMMCEEIPVLEHDRIMKNVITD